MHSSVKMTPVYIIRLNRRVLFEDGKYTNLCCKKGTMEEVEEYAKNIAKKYGARVESIA